MRGSDVTSGSLFSYVDLDARVPASHPLRAMRELVNTCLVRMDGSFEALYKEGGRPSIPPERLVRASLLQMLYTIRSERQLVERLEYDLLFRWFVGLGIDDAMFDASTFSKNRDRLLTAPIAMSRRHRAATASAISRTRHVRTRRMPRPRTPTHGCSARPRGRKASWPIWAML